MSDSRKSRKNATVFNPRASNEWSKNESKFGQRMLEKMGWKHGQGIGLNNQGITENIKVRLKLDSKGLGYQIKEDQWLEVRSEFSDLLSQLSQSVENDDETFIKGKKSLEAVSQSSKTRVHYHKFTHGKDIARYKKEDFIGILGKKENKEESIVSENKEFIHSGNMDEYFKSKKNKPKGSDLDVSSDRNLTVIDQSNNSNTEPVEEKHTNNSRDDSSNSNSRKRKKSVKTSSNNFKHEEKIVDENSIVQNVENAKEELTDDNSNSRKRKKSVKTSSNNFKHEEKIVDENSIVQNVENAKEELTDDNSNSRKRKKSVKTSSNNFKHEEKIVDENSIVQNVENAKEELTDDNSNSRKRKKAVKTSSINYENEESSKNKKVDENLVVPSLENTKEELDGDTSNSRKRKKAVKTSSNNYENDESSKNKKVDENLVVPSLENTKEELDGDTSNSRKRKKTIKTSNNDEENMKLSESKSVDKNLIIQNIENTKDEEIDDIGHIPQKKIRKSNLSSEVAYQKTDFEVRSVRESDINDPEDNKLPQKRKKSSKKLQNKNETEESRSNEVVDEKVIHQQIEKTKKDLPSLPQPKKKRDKDIISPSAVEFEPNFTNDSDIVKTDDISLQIENLNEKKKKKSSKKSDEISLKVSTEENKNKHECEEQSENHKNKTVRKKTKNSLDADSKSSEDSAPLKIVDDSPPELKKRKHKSKNLTETCLNIEKNINDRNSKEFMKSVIDYNCSNNVEDYISNFEKSRDELMNKYRERYKMKYLSSSNIQVFGDEFDGRKLDCKKPDSEELCVTKTVYHKNMSKAEKIIAKARLLKSIKDNTITHNFEGSNLTNILGYGSEIC